MEYARDFRSNGTPKEVWYIDLPKGSPEEVAARAWDDQFDAGTNAVGTYKNTELPSGYGSQFKRLNLEAGRARAPRDEIAEAAERLDMTVPRAATTDSLAAKQAAGALSPIPGVGAPIVKAANKTLDDLGSRVQGIVDDLGGATPQEAGHAVRDDVVDWIKRGSKDDAADIYKETDALMVGAEGPLTRTKAALDEITHAAQESRLPPPGIVRTLHEAVNDANGLSYEGLQNLRTQVGDMMNGRITPEPGMSPRALKQVYAALSDDLRDMAGTAGVNLAKGPNGKVRLSKKREAEFAEKGVQLWDEANARFQTEIAQRRDDLTRIVGREADVAPEAIVATVTRMAGSKGGADAGRLQQVIKSLTPQTQNDLAAAVIAHMGRNKDGFSPALFRTAYEGNLSPIGKQLLFPNAAHRQALDDIATVARAYEQLQRLGNPSGTGRVGSIVAGGGGLMAAPYATVGLAIGGYMLARLLAKPATAKKLAEISKSHLRALMAQDSRAMLAAQAAARELADAFENDGDSKPVRVNRIEDALKLPKGTQFETPDGRVKVR
jgi:hypothetical protein